MLKYVYSGLNFVEFKNIFHSFTFVYNLLIYRYDFGEGFFHFPSYILHF